MFKFESTLNIKLCKDNPEAIIVFGDNLIKRGKAGQAQIRDCPNAFGVPTKRLPSMAENAFFSDKEDEIKIVKSLLANLIEQHKNGKLIILPSNPIGSGLALLAVKSPKIQTLVDEFYVYAKKDINDQENI